MGFQDVAGKGAAIMQDPFSGFLGLGGMGDKGRNFLNGLPFVGGMFQGMFGDPEQEAMQRAMKEAQQKMERYRAQSMDSRMNAMNQGALAFGPRNNMLGQMMGQQGPAMDLGPMLQNPMSPQMQGDIRAAAFDPANPPKFNPRAQGPYGAG